MSSITAAVLEKPEELSIKQLQLDDPKPREVLIDLQAAGVCHTDYHFYKGDYEVPTPAVLGHEGAGIVEKVGEQVSAVNPGDHVVLSLLPVCGRCEFCRKGRPYLCPNALDVRFEGTLLDGTRRLSDGDEPVNHFYAQSSFANKAVVPIESVVRVSDEIPLKIASLLACGAMTGIGGILNTAEVESGETVAVFGCGGTGASAILGAKAISAGEIIAIDVVPEKIKKSKTIGASHTLNPEKNNVIDRIAEITNGGVDYAFDFVGFNPTVRKQAVEATRPGGTIVLSGGVDEDATANVFDLTMGGKTLTSNVAGSARPHVDIPRYVRMYLNGDLPLDRLLSSTYQLNELEEAFKEIRSGSALKCTLSLI